MTPQVCKDLLGGVPDHDRARLEIIIMDFAEECQRRLITHRPSPVLHLDDESQQSSSVTELDAWMSWYTSESAHEDVKSIITTKSNKMNPASATVSDWESQQHSSQVLAVPASAKSSESRANGSKSATSRYHIINAATKHHVNTSWFDDEEQSSEELHCSNGSEEERKEGQELTSWYLDDTVSPSGTMDQICQQEPETQRTPKILQINKVDHRPCAADAHGQNQLKGGSPTFRPSGCHLSKRQQVLHTVSSDSGSDSAQLPSPLQWSSEPHPVRAEQSGPPSTCPSHQPSDLTLGIHARLATQTGFDEPSDDEELRRRIREEHG